MRTDARIEIGEVVLEVTRAASPCSKIAPSFHDGVFTRVSQKVHPGWSRFYARVLREGAVSTGDRVVLTAALLLFDPRCFEPRRAIPPPKTEGAEVVCYTDARDHSSMVRAAGS